MIAGDLGKVMVLKELIDEEALPVDDDDVLSVEVDVSSVEAIVDCAVQTVDVEKAASWLLDLWRRVLRREEVVVSPKDTGACGW